jgi:hypothetical protein
VDYLAILILDLHTPILIQKSAQPGVAVLQADHTKVWYNARHDFGVGVRGVVGRRGLRRRRAMPSAGFGFSAKKCGFAGADGRGDILQRLPSGPVLLGESKVLIS